MDGHKPRNHSIVRAAGESLRIDIMAEGVETAEQLERLYRYLMRWLLALATRGCSNCAGEAVAAADSDEGADSIAYSGACE